MNGNPKAQQLIIRRKLKKIDSKDERSILFDCFTGSNSTISSLDFYPFFELYLNCKKHAFTAERAECLLSVKYEKKLTPDEIQEIHWDLSFAKIGLASTLKDLLKYRFPDGLLDKLFASFF
jgi:hypothetical protein